MNNLQNFRTETSVGILEFEGTPVCNNFDYNKFALDNGFIVKWIDSPENTDKYGGVGFVIFKNYTESMDLPYYLKKRLEILFIDGLPVIYSIK